MPNSQKTTATTTTNPGPQQQHRQLSTSSIMTIDVNPVDGNNSRLNENQIPTVSPPSYSCRVSIPVALEHPSILPNSSGNQGGLPSYNEAINPNAPPPSYESLFGRVRKAHKTRKGFVHFFKNVLILLVGTIGCTIILGTTLIVPLCMVIMGWSFLHECPAGPYIPVYLLVGGIFGLFKQYLYYCARVKQQRQGQQAEVLRDSSAITLVNYFMLAWFIIGSIWVYQAYEPNYKPTDGTRYCNKWLYTFAFWLITSSYALIIIAVMCVCTVSILSIFFDIGPRS